LKRTANIQLFIALFISLSLRAQYKEFDTFLGDTINIVDKVGLKQGRWVFFGKDSKGLKNKLLKFNQIITDGHYTDGIKEGLWKSYHQNTNKIKSEITYHAGEIDGKVKLYNDKGKPTHEGTIKNGEWVGDYYIYNSSGEKIKKTFDANATTSVLNFGGLVTKNGKPVDDVEINIERNELPWVNAKSGTDGSFSFKLELQNIYVVHFSKKGYHRLSILLNAYTDNINDPAAYNLKDWKVQMTDNFAATATNDLFGFIINKPSNKIYYIKRRKEFGADGSYEHLVKKQLKGISNSTKLIMATTMETNKKLEIENLRIEQEAKLKEIELLQKEQLLQQASLKEKENELTSKKLEAEKKEIAMTMLEQEKKIRELKLKEQENATLEQQLETERKAREIEGLTAAADKQKLEAIEQKKLLGEAEEKIAKDKQAKELADIQIEISNREKNVKEAELKAQQRSFNYVLMGLGVVGAFLFFMIRLFVQKKKANAVLESQKVEIESQKNDIEEKGRIIEEKNEETHQSILYAKRIQNAILPPPSEIDPYLKDYFILYKSKDIVSGDFYFFSDKHAEENKSVIIAAADCTGHGVPGAFMSLVGSEKLKDAVDVSHHPGKVIEELNIGLKTALRQSGDTGTRDGMDIAILTLPIGYEKMDSVQVEYAGANRPLWILKKDATDLIEHKATKHAVGGFTADDQPFTNNVFKFEKGDLLYIFSDGYADQFGGDKHKKMMTKRFKEVLLSIRGMKMQDQKEFLAKNFDDWKGENEQVDDILVIGIKL
jgi:serine phosphatase RsbU (regulator of sigma subunit)